MLRIQNTIYLLLFLKAVIMNMDYSVVTSVIDGVHTRKDGVTSLLSVWFWSIFFFL